LRSRAGKRSAIHLRPDTRYLMEGQPAELGSLRANLVVFVRAGKNLDNEYGPAQNHVIQNCTMNSGHAPGEANIGWPFIKQFTLP